MNTPNERIIRRKFRKCNLKFTDERDGDGVVEIPL